MDLMKKIVKKLRRAEEPPKKDEEELIFDEPEKAEEEVDEGFNDTVMERLGTLDDDVARVKVSINDIRKEVSELKNDLGRMDESLKDIMMLYEVVSTQINPFIGESKVTASSMEKLERLNDEIKDIKTILDDILIDLKILTLKELDVHSIVFDVLLEE